MKKLLIILLVFCVGCVSNKIPTQSDIKKIQKKHADQKEVKNDFILMGAFVGVMYVVFVNCFDHE